MLVVVARPQPTLSGMVMKVESPPLSGMLRSHEPRPIGAPPVGQPDNPAYGSTKGRVAAAPAALFAPALPSRPAAASPPSPLPPAPLPPTALAPAPAPPMS